MFWPKGLINCRIQVFLCVIRWNICTHSYCSQCVHYHSHRSYNSHSVDYRRDCLEWLSTPKVISLLNAMFHLSRAPSGTQEEVIYCCAWSSKDNPLCTHCYSTAFLSRLLLQRRHWHSPGAPWLHLELWQEAGVHQGSCGRTGKRPVCHWYFVKRRFEVYGNCT